MVRPDTLTDVLRATPEEDGVQQEGNTSNIHGDSASEILSTRHNGSPSQKAKNSLLTNYVTRPIKYGTKNGAIYSHQV
jgi:hypothetical protein